MYKAIIFDFFGVFCPDITLNWFKQTVPNYESKLSDFQAICTRSDYGTISRDNFFEEVSALSDVSVKEMIDGVEAQTTIDRSLVAFVEDLRERSYKICCLSNGTREWTLRVITDHGLGKLFDEIVLSGDLGIVKPNPEIYTETLNRLGIRPEEAIFVDDRQLNVDAANNLNISGLLFTDTPNLKKNLESLIGTSK